MSAVWLIDPPSSSESLETWIDHRAGLDELLPADDEMVVLAKRHADEHIAQLQNPREPSKEEEDEAKAFWADILGEDRAR